MTATQRLVQLVIGVVLLSAGAAVFWFGYVWRQDRQQGRDDPPPANWPVIPYLIAILSHPFEALFCGLAGIVFGGLLIVFTFL